MDATRLVMRQVLVEQASVEAPTQPRHVWNMPHDHLREFFLDAVNREEDEDYDWQRYERIVTELFPEYTLATFDEGDYQVVWSAVYDALSWNPGEMAALVQNEPQILLDHHARIIGAISDEFGWPAGQFARSVFRSVQSGQESKYREIPLQVLRRLDDEMPLSQDDWPGVEDLEHEADPFEKAKARFGVTLNFGDAFYLLPDGDMISGGGGGHGRGFDHRNIGYGGGGTRGMQEFMSLGAIRLMPEDGGLDMMIEPTSAQYRTLEGWIENFSPEGMPLDMQEGLGEFDERNDYYLRAARSKSYMFDPGENPRRIMGSIRRFYAGQDESLTECRHIIRRMLTESPVARHDISDEATAEFYFGIGHGDSDYMSKPNVSGYDEKDQYTDPTTHEIWLLVHGEVERSPQLDMHQIQADAEDAGFAPEDVNDYIAQQIEDVGEVSTISHNIAWSHLKPDDHWKGHYEGDTGRLSVINPGQYRWTGQLQGVLEAEFNPKEIHLFE